MFATAMNTSFKNTWNGALSLSTPDKSNIYDGRLFLFFKTIRGIDDKLLYEKLEKSSNEDLFDTFLLAFNTRDSRGGKGERDIGRKMLVWLFINFPEEFKKIYRLIPEYGRWDDLLCFFPGYINEFTKIFLSEKHLKIQNSIINFFGKQLNIDRESMLDGKIITLCAKWAPTEKDSDDKKYLLVEQLCKVMKITKTVYRKKYISPLRYYLDIVERYMCLNLWYSIDYSRVPSCAMKKLKKAFEKHEPENFNNWKNNLESGKTKVNAKALYPHELVKEIRQNGYADEVCLAQWKVLEDQVKSLGKLTKTLVVVDTSGSMESLNYLPLDIATAMGLLVSNIVEGEFHNHVITFHDVPTFQVLNDGNLSSRYQQLRNIPWGGSTNLQKTFDLILNKATNAGLTNEQMPDKLFIISDMQFNQIEGGIYNSSTNFEYIDKEYKKFGYTRPQIVFWNVNGISTDFPVDVGDNGTCLVSGASPSIIKSIIESPNFDSISIMRTELDKSRYYDILNSLKCD
jgi:hypothetical protein